MYQNKIEKFLTEGFDSRLLDRFKNESQEEENGVRSMLIPTEEEMTRKVPVMEEEMTKEETAEEETFQKYAPVGDKPTEKPSASKPSATPNGDKKAKEATDKQEERPDINKHLMDDGNNGLSNRNSDTINPININVSYNNNRPFTVNDFNNPENERNTQNGQESGKRTTDINSYRFDDGCMNRSVKSGIDNINQKYFPAYLENPLNKNQPKVDDNYEMKMMKRILNEKNDPSPVLLENPWSEFKPLDK
jgi:outer membrane biosynthesis protein TonB